MRDGAIEMCLAVPGKLIEIRNCETVLRTGKVDFGGVVKEINLAFVPTASVGEYVLVHAGIAIGVINEDEASKVVGYLDEIYGSDKEDAGR
jgi:hydrogenase expression/formation protein HypC